MPEQSYWETLFDIEGILDAFALSPDTGAVAELAWAREVPHLRVETPPFLLPPWHFWICLTRGPAPKPSAG